MQSRIAVLVLAHRPAALQFLLDVLSDYLTVFVHVDAKTDLSAASLHLPAHATLIEPRIEVYWGGWSMMQATLALIDAARAAGDFHRFVLISGDALPALPPDRLEAELLDESREYIEAIDVPDDPSLAATRIETAVERHGWGQPWRRYNPVAWDHRLFNPMQGETAAAHYGISLDRMDQIRLDAARFILPILNALRVPCPYANFFYGSQWWALTGATMEAILPEFARTDVQRFFRYSQVPDEHMVQTVIGNHPTALQGRTVVGAPMWYEPDRRIVGMTLADLHRAGTTPNRLFARKFVPESAPDIVAAIRAGRLWL